MKGGIPRNTETAVWLSGEEEKQKEKTSTKSLTRFSSLQAFTVKLSSMLNNGVLDYSCKRVSWALNSDLPGEADQNHVT